MQRIQFGQALFQRRQAMPDIERVDAIEPLAVLYVVRLLQCPYLRQILRDMVPHCVEAEDAIRPCQAGPDDGQTPDTLPQRELRGIGIGKIGRLHDLY